MRVDDVVTVEQAAETLGVSGRTIHKRIASGQMQAQMIGSRIWVIPSAEVERWRKIGRMKPGPKAKEPLPKQPRGRPRKERPGAT